MSMSLGSSAIVDNLDAGPSLCSMGSTAGDSAALAEQHSQYHLQAATAQIIFLASLQDAMIED